MPEVAHKAELLSRLLPYRQEHVLAFWDELDEASRVRLAAQIEALDLDLIASLYRNEVDQPDWAELARRAEPPPAVRLAERTPQPTWLGFSSEDARLRGIEALATGKVGVLLTAGGQGSRLGFEQPKSLFPIGPLSGASLLQIHIEKVRALAKRYGQPAPLYLMTSPVTHDETVAFLAENDRFGLAEDDLVVFCQGTMPAVDAQTGKLLLAEKGSLFLSPDGHGGTVAALAASGAIDHMRHRGVEQLFYLQVDNPLAPIGDPELIGYQLLAESELTSLAVAKQSPQDKLGNFVMIDDRLHVIEYSDFPDDVAERRADPPPSQGGARGGIKQHENSSASANADEDQPGELVFWAGSVAIHVFDVTFLERALTLQDSLPFHVALKKAAYVDETGRRVEPSEPNALKFERFIFDLLPHARRPIVVEYAEEEAFAPLKNAPGAEKDSPEYVQHFMLDQHRRWLAAAGAETSPGVDVEISPLFALDAEGVARRVSPGTVYHLSTYLAGP